jgi:hypothetical protein
MLMALTQDLNMKFMDRDSRCLKSSNKLHSPPDGSHVCQKHKEIHERANAFVPMIMQMDVMSVDALTLGMLSVQHRDLLFS